MLEFGNNTDIITNFKCQIWSTLKKISWKFCNTDKKILSKKSFMLCNVYIYVYKVHSVQEGQLFPPSVAHSPHSAHGKLAANEAKR